MLVGAVLGALFVPTPYVLLEPGSVRPTENRISIEGAKSFDDESDVLFTTVYVDRATLFGLLRGNLDDAVEIHTQEEIYGREGRDASQKVNQQEMDLSKLVATREALEFLGYDAEFTADGARVTQVLPGSAADGHLRPGDVIVAVDGAPIALPADLHEALAGRAPGDEVTVTVIRDEGPPASRRHPGRRRKVEVALALALGPAEDDPARAVMGVSVQPESPRVDSPGEGRHRLGHGDRSLGRPRLVAGDHRPAHPRCPRRHGRHRRDRRDPRRRHRRCHRRHRPEGVDGQAQRGEGVPVPGGHP